METIIEIIICDRCKGLGKVKKSELVDYHHNEYDEWEEVCTYCNGTGRLKKITEIAILKLVNKDLALENVNTKTKKKG